MLTCKKNNGPKLAAIETHFYEAGISNGSCFGFWAPVCRLWVPVFCNVPTHFFGFICNVPIFHNSLAQYNILVAHYKETGA